MPGSYLAPFILPFMLHHVQRLKVSAASHLSRLFATFTTSFTHVQPKVLFKAKQTISVQLERSSGRK